MAPLKIKLGLLGGKRKKGGSVSSFSLFALHLGSSQFTIHQGWGGQELEVQTQVHEGIWSGS